MNAETYIKKIKELISENQLNEALTELRSLFDKSPRLNEVILQSARFQDIRQQIRRGVVNYQDAVLTKNQIIAALLDLLDEVTNQIATDSSFSKTSSLRSEMEHAISLVNGKNVVNNSKISAGGNVNIGDVTHVTESETSRRLRLFLFVFVPVLAIAVAFFWYQYQKLKTPLNLTVALDNQTPNAELPFESGTLRLRYGDESRVLSIEQEAIFKGIPANFYNEKISLYFEAEGFETIDTTFFFENNLVVLPIRHDNSLARIFGDIKDGDGKPLGGVQIQVQDLTTSSNPSGLFLLPIPFDQQRKQQQVSAYLPGYSAWAYTFPVSSKEEVHIILQKK